MADMSRVYLAIDTAREMSAELDAYEKFIDEREKEADQFSLSSLVGGLLGGFIGLSVGGLKGAMQGYGYGSSTAGAIAAFDDYDDTMADIANIDPGKFMRTTDLADIQKLRKGAKDLRTTTALSTGVGLLDTYFNTAGMEKAPPGYYKDYTFAEKVQHLAKDPISYEGEGVGEDLVTMESVEDMPPTSKKLPGSIMDAVKAARSAGTPSNELARFISKNYALKSYMAGGNISDSIGDYLLSQLFPLDNSTSTTKGE